MEKLTEFSNEELMLELENRQRKSAKEKYVVRCYCDDPKLQPAWEERTRMVR